MFSATSSQMQKWGYIKIAKTNYNIGISCIGLNISARYVSESKIDALWGIYNHQK